MVSCVRIRNKNNKKKTLFLKEAELYNKKKYFLTIIFFPENENFLNFSEFLSFEFFYFYDFFYFFNKTPADKVTNKLST